jgi:hypothetical protein
VSKKFQWLFEETAVLGRGGVFRLLFVGLQGDAPCIGRTPRMPIASRSRSRTLNSHVIDEFAAPLCAPCPRKQLDMTLWGAQALEGPLFSS